MTNATIAMRTYAGENDLQSIADLLNLVSVHDNLDDTYSTEDLQNEFSAPGFDTARDIRMWEDSDGQLVAYSQSEARPHNEHDTLVDGHIYLRIHPDHRSREIADAAIAWGEGRLREIGRERGLPVELRAGEVQHYTYMQEIFERHGMQQVRYFFRMVRDLSQPIAEPRFAEGYSLRHVAGAEDEERWVDAYNYSFIDHYNFHLRTVESHRHWLSGPDYSRERDLIAVTADNTVAAFSLCWIHNDDNERNQRLDGWVHTLGVRRGHRKLGLGKAILLASLHMLKADGMAYAKLGVDAENPTGALQLYESVGFKRDETWVTYTKELGAGE